MSLHTIQPEKTKNQKGKTAKSMEVALHRMQCIAPLLHFIKDDGSIDKRAPFAQTLKEASVKAGCSKITLKRYLDSYAKDGLQGLRPDYHPSHASELKTMCAKAIDRAFRLRLEENATVAQIIEVIESEGLALPGQLKRATVQRYLQNAGLGKRELNCRAGGNKGALKNGEFFTRYQAKQPFDLLLADITYASAGKILSDLDGKPIKQVYISAFIDDASRYLWIRVTQNQDQDSVNLLLKEIILQNDRVPGHVGTDNGSVYRSNSFRRACDLCGIKLSYCPPRAGHCKGKIERVFRTHDLQLEEQIRNCTAPISFSAFEMMCQDWCDKYNNTVHSALKGKTPAQAFGDKSLAGKKAPGRSLLDLAFAEPLTRKLQPDATVSVYGVAFKVNHLDGLKRKSVISLEIFKDPDGTPHVMQVLDNLTLVELKPLIPVDALKLKSVLSGGNQSQKDKKLMGDKRLAYSSLIKTRYREKLKERGLYTGEDDFNKLLSLMLSPVLIEAANEQERLDGLSKNDDEEGKGDLASVWAKAFDQELKLKKRKGGKKEGNQSADGKKPDDNKQAKDKAESVLNEDKKEKHDEQ